jgi:hypothetical protein
VVEMELAIAGLVAPTADVVEPVEEREILEPPARSSHYVHKSL